MRVLIQRVSRAAVFVKGGKIAAIDAGLLLLLGISQAATRQRAAWLADKAAGLRIFPDEKQKLNLSVQDIKGELLVVSQFTLWAQANKGNRPSFSQAAQPELALPLYHFFIERLLSHTPRVRQGQFGAIMQVELINDGPVTIILDAPL